MALTKPKKANHTEKNPRIWAAKSGVTIYEGAVVGRYPAGTYAGYIDNMGADPSLIVVGVARHNCGTAPAGWTGEAFAAQTFVDEKIWPVDFSTSGDATAGQRNALVYGIDESKGSMSATGYNPIGAFWEADSSTSGRVGVGPSFVAAAQAAASAGAPALSAATVNGVVTSNVSSLSSFTVASADYTFSAGQIALLVGQTTKSQNGPYVVGAVNTGVAALTRPPWWPAGGSAVSGFEFRVAAGTQGANSRWILRTQGAITIDTTSVDIDMIGGNWVAMQHVTSLHTQATPSGVFVAGATLKARLSGVFRVDVHIAFSNSNTADPVTVALVSDTVADGAGAVLASADKAAHGVAGFGTYGTRGFDMETIDGAGAATLTFNSAAFNTAQIVQKSEQMPTLTGLLTANATGALHFAFSGICHNAIGTTKTPFTIGNQVAFGVKVTAAAGTLTFADVTMSVYELPNQ